MDLKSKNSKRGISLIVLVITIMVMIILASAIILSLSSSGIIGKANEAREANDSAMQKASAVIDEAQGIIDVNTEGTLAYEIKVGDYVEYNYTGDSYTVSAANSGLQTRADIQADQTIAVEQVFSSATGGNYAVTKWRVLSKTNGIIKLVPAEYGNGTPVPGTSTTQAALKLTDAAGWRNGVKILNNMCDKLYSTDLGIARSLNVDDVNDVMGYKPTKAKIWDTTGEKEVDYGTTISKAIKQLNITSIPAWEDGVVEWNTYGPESNKDVGDYELNMYTYTAADYMATTSEQYKMIFKTNTITWLANTCVNAKLGPESDDDHVNFSIRVADEKGEVSHFCMYQSGHRWNRATGRSVASFVVCPVVVLKTGLKPNGKNSDGAWIIAES